MSRPVEPRVEGFDALREKTFQALVNYMSYGMSVEDAVNKPDFFLPGHHPDGSAVAHVDPATGLLRAASHKPQQQRGRGVLRSARERGTVMG